MRLWKNAELIVASACLQHEGFGGCSAVQSAPACASSSKSVTAEIPKSKNFCRYDPTIFKGGGHLSPPPILIFVYPILYLAPICTERYRVICTKRKAASYAALYHLIIFGTNTSKSLICRSSRILSLVRLPIPPLSHVEQRSHYNGNQICPIDR